jgi:hypothetical protein
MRETSQKTERKLRLDAPIQAVLYFSYQLITSDPARVHIRGQCTGRMACPEEETIAPGRD